MKTKNVPYVDNKKAQSPEREANSSDGDVKGYGSLSLEEQLELFADLIVEQLIRQEKP